MSDLYIEVLFDIVSLDRSFTYRYSGDNPEEVRVGVVVYGKIHNRREKGWVIDVGVDPPKDLTILEVDELSNVSIPNDFLLFALELQKIYGGSLVSFVKLLDSASSRIPAPLVALRMGQDSRLQDPRSIDLTSSALSDSKFAVDSSVVDSSMAVPVDENGLGEARSFTSEYDSERQVTPASEDSDERNNQGLIESIRISPNVSIADIVRSRIAMMSSFQRVADTESRLNDANSSSEGGLNQNRRDDSGKVLVVYPEYSQLNFDALGMSGDGVDYVVIDKPLSKKARQAHFGARILLGTRISIFAPIDGLSTIVVVDPASAGHRAISHPRVDSLSVALLRRQLHGVDVVLATGFPDPIFHRIARPKGDPKDLNAWPNVRMGMVRTGSKPISEELIDWIGDSLQKGIGPLLVVYNKKGRVNRYICRRCKEIVSCEVCSSPLVYGEVYSDDGSSDISPVRRYNFSTYRAEELFDRLHARGLFCPNCHSSTPFACAFCKGSNIRVASLGSQRIADELWGTFADRVVHVDSEKDELPQVGIVVGTSMLLNRYRKALGVALLDVDAIAGQFGFSSINRLYEFWFKASRALIGSRLESPLFVGARSTEVGYVKPIIEKRPRDLYQYDLVSRRDFSMPPYSFQVRITRRRQSSCAFEEVRSAFLDVLSAISSDQRNFGSLGQDLAECEEDFGSASIFDNSEESLVLVTQSEEITNKIIGEVRAKVGNSFLVERFIEDI